MPTNFANTLQTVSPVQVPRQVSTQGQDLARTGEVIEQTAATLKGVFDNRILGKVAGAASEVASQTYGYEKARDAILDKLLTAGDKGQFAGYVKELGRLKNGEVQGVLSPSSASARMNQIARVYINRSPRLAGEIREMLRVMSGDISTTSSADDQDPIDKARNEILLAAQKEGKLPSVWLKERQAESTAKSLEDQFKMKVTLGDINENDFRNLVQAKKTETLSILTAGMEADIKAGTFIQEDWIGNLNAGKAQYRDALLSQILEYENSTGVKFRKEIVQQIAQESDKLFNDMISMAESSDTLTRQHRLIETKNKIIAERDVEYWRNIIGPMATLLRGTESMWDYLKDWNSFATKVEAGLEPGLRELAKYDPMTRSFLGLLKTGDGWTPMFENVRKMLDGEVASSGNKEIDTLTDAMALDIASKSTTIPAEAEKLVVGVARGGELEGLLARTDVHKIIKSSSAAQQAIDDSAAQGATSLAANVSAGNKDRIVLREKDEQEPFSTPPLSGRPRGPSESLPRTDRAALDLTTYLNDTYQLLKIYKSQAELDAWKQEVFTSLVKPEQKEEEPSNDN